MSDVFERFRLGRSWASDVYAVLLHDQPVDLSTGWTVTAEATIAGEVRTWTVTGPDRFVDLAHDAVDLGGPQPLQTSTVQLRNTPAATEGWSPFSADFEVVIAKDGARYTVLSGFLRGDDRASDDSPTGGAT